MVDLVGITSAAVALLGPYLASLAGKVGTAAADEIAAGAANSSVMAIGSLYNSLRRKFASDHDEDACRALSSLEAVPNSEGRQSTLAEVLLDRASADPEFAAELARLVDAAT